MWFSSWIQHVDLPEEEAALPSPAGSLGACDEHSRCCTGKRVRACLCSSCLCWTASTWRKRPVAAWTGHPACLHMEESCHQAAGFIMCWNIYSIYIKKKNLINIFSSSAVMMMTLKHSWKKKQKSTYEVSSSFSMHFVPKPGWSSRASSRFSIAGLPGASLL